MKTLSRVLVASLLAVSVSLANAATLTFAPAATGLLKDVDASDGVDESEAKIIAEAYFNMHVGCGVYEGISDSSEAWAVEGKFGYSGDPISGFLINKRTGAITSSIGPSYSRPSDMFLLVSGTTESAR